MNILDCNVQLAAHADIEDIERYCREYGIRYCALRSEYAQLYHPLDGNALLVKRSKDFSSLYPIYTAGAPEGGDFPAVHDFVAQVLQERGIGIYFEPPNQRLLSSASPWSMGEYYEELAQAQLPFMIKAEHIAPHVLYEISRLQPNLKIVLLDIHYTLVKELYALLPVAQNLYLESSGLRGYRMISDICGTFGAHRLVFGSRYPSYEPGAALADLYYADISDSEREIIACNQQAFENLDVKREREDE